MGKDSAARLEANAKGKKNVPKAHSRAERGCESSIFHARARALSTPFRSVLNARHWRAAPCRRLFVSQDEISCDTKNSRQPGQSLRLPDRRETLSSSVFSLSGGQPLSRMYYPSIAMSFFSSTCGFLASIFGMDSFRTPLSYFAWMSSCFTSSPT